MAVQIGSVVGTFASGLLNLPDVMTSRKLFCRIGRAFSAAIAELSPPEYVGPALTIQPSMGFWLNLGSIQLVPVMVDAFGWPAAFLMLAVGPFVGIVAMLGLRRLPESLACANGRR